LAPGVRGWASMSEVKSLSIGVIGRASPYR
jgi:hypothetical protein